MAIDLNTHADMQTEFAVDMTCQSCVNAVQKSLQDLQGVERYDIDLEKKRVTITGKTPPSHLLTALKSTNRQVIVRGSSSTSTSPSFPLSAAVSILESPLPLPASIASTSFSALATTSSSPIPQSLKGLPGMNEEEFSQKVFGICRFVQIAPKTILMDLTVRLPPPAAVGLSAGERAFEVYISTAGNMVDPPITTGKPLVSLGRIQPDKDGYGDLFREVDGELWEWVGRGCVVQATAGLQNSQAEDGKTGRIFAGVVARSAGAWGNEKTVCACSGRTMWEEGRDMQGKAMM